MWYLIILIICTMEDYFHDILPCENYQINIFFKIVDLLQS